MKRLLLLFFISLVSFLSNGQIIGENIFDDSYVHTLEIFSNYPSGILVDSMGNRINNDRIAVSRRTDIDWTYFQVQVKIDGNTVDSVGIRKKCGDLSCSQLKPSLKLDFNEFVSGKKYDGLKKINVDNCLADSSLMREKLNYDMLSSLGLCSRRTSFVKVTIDGQYMGVYVFIEQVNKAYLDRCFQNHAGNLYKCFGYGNLPDLGTTTLTVYQEYIDLKTNKTANDWSALMNVMNKVNYTPIVDYKDTISKYFDVEAILIYLAVSTYTTSFENLMAQGNNGYWYHDSISDKFVIIPEDYDFSFLSANISSYIYSPTNAELINPINNKPFFSKILAVPEFQTKYYDYCCHLKNNLGHKDSLKDKIDNYKNILTNASLSPPDNCDYTSYLDIFSNVTYEGLKDFADKRYIKFQTEITSLNHTCSALPISTKDYSEKEKFRIYPNPADSKVFIQALKKNEINSIQLFDLMGREININPIKKNNSLLEISTSELTTGIYLLHINGTTIKLIKD